jgi:hypothetical protein
VKLRKPQTYCAEHNKYVTHSHWGRHCKRKVHKQPLARPIGKQRVRCRGWNPKSESQASVHHDADRPPAAGRDSSLASHDEGGTQLIDDGLGASIVRDDCTPLLAKIKSICTSLEAVNKEISELSAAQLGKSCTGEHGANMETEEEIDREMDRWIEGYLAQTHRLGTRRYRTIQSAHTYVKTASLLVPIA